MWRMDGEGEGSRYLYSRGFVSANPPWSSTQRRRRKPLESFTRSIAILFLLSVPVLVLRPLTCRIWRRRLRHWQLTGARGELQVAPVALTARPVLQWAGGPKRSSLAPVGAFYGMRQSTTIAIVQGFTAKRLDLQFRFSLFSRNSLVQPGQSSCNGCCSYPRLLAATQLRLVMYITKKSSAKGRTAAARNIIDGFVHWKQPRLPFGTSTSGYV